MTLVAGWVDSSKYKAVDRWLENRDAGPGAQQNDGKR
jgi:hypothetical protein